MFERSSRQVRLTPLGEQLHRDLSAGYRQILRGIDDAREAARGVSGTLTLGTVGPHSLAFGDIRDSVCLEDLGDCAVVQGQRIPQDMEETLNPYRTPAGRPVRRGPKVSTWQEALTTVASGRAVAGVTTDVAEFYPWPGLAFVPIRDAPPCQWALVWRSTVENPLIHAFVQAATDIAAATG
ncbi:LysR substrate-binding domain-containing protein [Nonomuraea angiospora]|uniref:LysR substrate-binding domain-containing protein n=1 Tax=Nonomuraea angiospora TaxID=46172 RepID=UPI0033D8D080